MNYRPIRIAGFRSLVEFEWALTFHACGIKYAYEPQLFTLQTGEQYLPDFYLITSDGLKCWAEIKVQHFKHEETKKCNLLSLGQSDPVIELRSFPSTGRLYDGWKDGEHFNVKFDSHSFAFGKNIQAKADEIHSIVNAIQRAFDSQRNPSYQDMIKLLQQGKGNEAWKLVKPSCREGVVPFNEALTHLQKQGWHDYLAGDNDVPIA